MLNRSLALDGVLPFSGPERMSMPWRVFTAAFAMCRATKTAVATMPPSAGSTEMSGVPTSLPKLQRILVTRPGSSSSAAGVETQDFGKFLIETVTDGACSKVIAAA